MSAPQDFSEHITRLFYSELSSLDPEHEERYLRDAQFHHAMQITTATVSAMASVLREDASMNLDAIEDVVRGVARRFARSAEVARTMHAVAEKAPKLKAWIDEPGKLG